MYLVVSVFDGRSLPAKAITTKSRKRAREENAQKAREAEAEGRYGDAHGHYQKTTMVTPHMVHRVIQALKEHKVEYIVSPYEA